MEVYIPGQQLVVNTSPDDELQHYGVIGMKWGVRKQYAKAHKRMNRKQRRYARQMAKEKTKSRLEKNVEKLKRAKARKDAAGDKYGQAVVNYDKHKEYYREGQYTKKELNAARNSLKAARSEYRAEKARHKNAKRDYSTDMKDVYSKEYGKAVSFYMSKDGKQLAEMRSGLAKANLVEKAAGVVGATTAAAAGYGLMTVTGSPIGFAPVGAGYYAGKKLVGRPVANKIVDNSIKKAQSYQ